MPESDDNTDVLSKKIATARTLLLQTLQTQLDDSLTSKLIPNAEGVPFTHFDNDPPQVEAIKKVINCLYHAEHAMNHWENTSLTSPAQGVYAITQVYKALAMFNDASPEIQAIVTDNYALLEPVFTSTYEVIKKSGWLGEFGEMNVTDKASTLIGQGTDLLGRDPKAWNASNPLIATFTQISELINSLSDSQKGELTAAEKKAIKDRALSILDELDNNAFFHKFTLGSLEESKAVNDLLAWFKTIQEDDLEFTRDSMERYISWTNQYLPALLMAADQLERQNYLKQGTLSGELCSSVDKLSKEVNEQLAHSSYDFKGRLVTTDSLAAAREQKITESQIKNVHQIQKATAHINEAEQFYAILAKYKGKSFNEILETDRIHLRQIYPELQSAFAHQNLDLEHKLTAVLNVKGPEEELVDNSWWGSAVGAYNYVSGFVVSGEIDKSLATETSVTQFFEKQIAAEKLKLEVSEKSRELLIPADNKKKQMSIEERTDARFSELKRQFPLQSAEKHIAPGDLKPVKASSLNNFKGNISYVQELKLSNKVRDTRESLTILVDRHLTEDRAYFSTPPYKINDNDPDHVKQIKEVENGLRNLESALYYLEQLENAGTIQQAWAFISLAKAAYNLKGNINKLSPEAIRVLAPIIEQANAYSRGLSDIDYRSDDLSDLEKLKSLHTEVAIVNETADLRVAVEAESDLQQSESDEETLPETPKTDYAKIIESARIDLLDRVRKSTSAPLANALKPAEQGVPFVHLDEDPPQVEAVKKLINSMYHAETATRLLQSTDAPSESVIDKIALAHRRAAALSQVYKALESFSGATPEVQSLIHENYDLVEPVISYGRSLADNYGLTNEIGLLNATKVVGSAGGRGLNLIQPDASGASQSATLVAFASELPAFLNSIAANLDENHALDQEELKITEEQMDSIAAMAELFLENMNSLENYGRIPHAIVGLLELIGKMKAEGYRVQDSSLEAYQQWFKKNYPELLCMMDELETRNYLKPGTLSDPVIKEVDKINRKLNESIKPPNNEAEGPEKIVLAVDVKPARESNLRNIRGEHLMGFFRVQDQEQTATSFFDILKRYEGKTIADMSTADRNLLKKHLAEIQGVLTDVNVDATNELVSALKHLEQGMPLEHPLPCARLLKLEQPTSAYLKKESNSHLFKVRIIDEALLHIRPERLGTDAKHRRMLLDDAQLSNVRHKYLRDKAMKESQPAAELQPVAISSLHTIRGNIALIQEMQLSSAVTKLIKQEEDIVKNKLSPHVASYLIKPEGQILHDIKADDPTIPSQIKQVENGLHHLESALLSFEHMSKEDSLVKQVRSLVEIASEAQELKESVEALSPELKQHYAPIINQILDLTKMIQTVEYNKSDAEELKSVFKNAKGQLLKLENPPDIPDASRDHSNSSSEEEFDPLEKTGERGLKLGVKYAHLASPPLEQARQYLIKRYPHAYGEQANEVRSFNREELASDAFMRQEIDRINELLDGSSVFNTNKPEAMINLGKQLLRVGAQAGELADMANQILTKNYIEIKENAYRDLIIPLSQEEDYLCLKPGTLLEPGMLGVNQLFVSAALELEMPFKQKLDLFDDAHFVEMLVKQSEQDLQALLKEQEINPNDKNLELKILIKQDKLTYLRQQDCMLLKQAEQDLVALLKEQELNPEDKDIELKIRAKQEQLTSLRHKKLQDAEEIKSTLLDAQFEVYLRTILKNSYLTQPLIQQYEVEMREVYRKNKGHLLTTEDSGLSLLELLRSTEKQKIADYLLVDKAYNKLNRFSLGLPPKNQDLIDYIGHLNTQLTDSETPIGLRAKQVKGLPRDSEFMEKICSADEGTGFFKRFTQFVERFTTCIARSAKTNLTIVDAYYQIKMEQKMGNIESSQSYKDRLKTIRDDKPVEQLQESPRLA
ncbi:hypothetical protein [Legionella shakespearei]|uniref:SdhB protein, substrate of the Dot/Icm system n=1 Tax=Legionella shakespearei DSM 23087 TaxID=1122169 RepID=A0A0W0YWQ8_9GAMM|nr:hypothetical protein [Legionella shakespearei]KTD61275.1 SdhB protein, substrate of the Dot/Icm system [Legionella shakespearei DSM 23087]